MENQFELAVRQALFGNAPLEDRLFIAEAIFKIIRDDADLLERAGRYVECTTITLGAYRNPIRTTLINMFGIVPGYAAKANHGVPTGVAVPAFS